MKKLFILIPLLLTAMAINAQSVSYTYDNAGNRTTRVFSMSPAPPHPEETPQVITALPDLIAEKAIVIYKQRGTEYLLRR